MMPKTWHLCASLLFTLLVGSSQASTPAETSFQDVSSTGKLHRFWPNSLTSYHRILEIAEEENWDVWFASPYAEMAEEDGGWLRVPHQIPLNDRFMAQKNTGRIDVYMPQNSMSQLHVQEVHSLSLGHLVEPIHAQIPPQPAGALYLSNDSPSNSSFHDDYRVLPSINSFLQSLAQDYPDLLKVVRIGLSAEGRDLWAVEISSDTKSLRAKKGVVISGPQHSREWIATSAAVHMIHSLVHPDGSLHELLENFNFYVIPVPNPDGYVWTWEGDRFWYKNRQSLGPTVNCVGIDTNRNWGYKWRKTAENGGPILTTQDDADDEDDDDFTAQSEEYLGKKPKLPIDPCSHWFPGVRKWQAPEVNDLANYITTLPNLMSFLDLRSYGQMVSTPFSYTCKRQPKAAEDQMEAALGATSAARRSGGVAYAAGSLCSQLYAAPGNVLDWIYKRKSVKYSYSIHLRDTGTFGFSLPPEYIRPVAQEVEEMLKSLAGFILFRGFGVDEDTGSVDQQAWEWPLDGEEKLDADDLEIEVEGSESNHMEDEEELLDQWVLIDGKWRWMHEQ
ncbi:peptidase M14 [Flagelloscypha sp. PMI_526]|nr:peptidase M14 [Flagelloscypha sp. PMI_526]